MFITIDSFKKTLMSIHDSDLIQSTYSKLIIYKQFLQISRENYSNVNKFKKQLHQEDSSSDRNGSQSA
jgi:hypothetical protein